MKYNRGEGGVSMSKKIYDVIVIGGGAAGMSAGIYSGRAKMKTLVLEQGSVGGQAKTTNEIVNYPGIRHTTGPELMEQMHLQAEDFGVAFAQAEVLEAQLEGEIKVLKTTNGDYETRSVIRKMVEKYDGSMEVHAEENRFRVSLLLYLGENGEEA